MSDWAYELVHRVAAELNASAPGGFQPVAIRANDLEAHLGTEPDEDPVLGTIEEQLIPADAVGILWGAPAAGKTTLAVELAFHVAAGIPWNGVPVPKPLNVLFIENEGSGKRFKRKVARKLTGWTGPPLVGEIHVHTLDEGRLDLRLEADRETLARLCIELEIGLVFLGPLFSCGMEGGGTPEQTNAFAQLVADVQARVGRSVACMLLHHPNGAGKISGANAWWVHLVWKLVAEDKGRVRLVIEKSRDSSLWQGHKFSLMWAENESFLLAEQQSAETRRGDLTRRVLELFANENKWRSQNGVCTALSIGGAAGKRDLRAFLNDPARFESLTGTEINERHLCDGYTPRDNVGRYRMRDDADAGEDARVADFARLEQFTIDTDGDWDG